MNRTRIMIAAVVLAMGSTALASQRESYSWTIINFYNANETKLPRVLLVGDSICAQYTPIVIGELSKAAYVASYATSKCVADRSYIKELTYILEEYDYSVIHFNNGLHSFGTDPTEWEAALRAVVKVLREKGKGAKLIYATATPPNDPAMKVKIVELNAIARKIMKENDIPIDDLFGLMDPLDRTKFWGDVFHFQKEGVNMQAKQVADFVRKALPAPAAVPAALAPKAALAGQRESTLGSVTSFYGANETNLPRVLFIGDSVCGNYTPLVSAELGKAAYVASYVTDKCVTDRSYIKELTYVLEEYDYGVIHFNNGLHSLDTDRTEWEAALRTVVKVLREKGKGAKLIYATATPPNDPAMKAKVMELNAIALKVMKENNIPIDDLFGLMDPLDRTKFWSTVVLFKQEAVSLQAKQAADCVRKALPAPAAVPAPVTPAAPAPKAP